MVVSPFFPRTFLINSTHMRSTAVTSGYLYIGKVDGASNVTITATSEDLTCSITLMIQQIEDKGKIYNKKDMSSSYKFENDDSLRFMLNDYFGGSNLNYNIKGNKSKDITYDLEHFKTYSHNWEPEENITMYRIVEIDASSYWLVTFSDESIQFFLCSLVDGSISCEEDTASKQNLVNETVLHADGGRREDGTLIMSWTYSSSKLGHKVLGKTGCTWIFTYNSRYSAVRVANRYTCFVEKTMNRISFYNGEKLDTFDKESFTADEL